MRTLSNRVYGGFISILWSLAVSVAVAGCGPGNESGVSPGEPPGALAAFAGNLGGAGNSDGSGAEARFNYPVGITADSSGNVYVADTSNRIIRKITSAGVVSTLAGSAGASGGTDGPGAEARFQLPTGVAIDAAVNLYVADSTGHTIRRITPDGVVSTLAGSSGVAGSADGQGENARFYLPEGITTDSDGNIYVAEAGNHMIRKISSTGVVSALAGGAGVWGSNDGTGPGARFNSPHGVATDGAGNIYVADTNNHTIRKIDPTGIVTTLAGLAGVAGGSDGAGSEARFSGPLGVASDIVGNVYVADSGGHTIRKISPAGAVSTLAGALGARGSVDGSGAEARFSYPQGVSTNRTGDIYVADTYNTKIRKIRPNGIVSTLAGTSAAWGSSDGIRSEAGFNVPSGTVTDMDGNVYVADRGNHTIRKITPAGVVRTLAGSAEVEGGADGTGAEARFFLPTGVATDSVGNLFVADSGNHTVRKVTPAGVVSTIAGLARVTGSVDGTGAEARFYIPTAIAIDRAGNLYVTDYYAIRKVTPAGTVTTVSEIGGVEVNSGAISSNTYEAVKRTCQPSPRGVWLCPPGGIAIGSAGAIYIADSGRNEVRKIMPNGSVTTLPGTFLLPTGVATDNMDNVYIADSSNHTIQRITPAGTVTTITGVSGQSGFKPGALPGVLAYPSGLALFGASLYVTMDNGVAVIDLP